MNKNDLKPKSVFEQFARINEIPRPSKHEEKMIEYLKQWGNNHSLETTVDETGKIICCPLKTPAQLSMWLLWLRPSCR